MAARCMNCSKGVMWGHKVSHAKNRTNRAFHPNLHNARIMIGGQFKRMKLCTKCLRMIKKATMEQAASKTTPAATA